MSDPQPPSGFAAPNYFAVPNEYADERLAGVETLGELKVTLAIFRRTFGWHKRSDAISLTQLQADTGLRRQTVVEGLRKAIERGVVTAVEDPRRKQATVYSIDVWYGNRTTERSDNRTTGSGTETGPTKETSVGGEQQTLDDLGGSERKTASAENGGSESKSPPSPAPSRSRSDSPAGLAANVEQAWRHWLRLSDGDGAPSPSQTRMLERALKESTLALVMQAMEGLVEWRKERGGAMSLSRIFKTRPGGDSLTDQIAWWAAQSGGPGGANGFTSEAIAKINRLKDHVRRNVDRGEALNRLSEEYGIVGIPPQDERGLWKFEVQGG